MMAQQAIEKTLAKVRKQGLSHTLHDVALKVVNMVFPYKILKVISIARVDPAFLECPRGYTAGLLTQPMLGDLARDPIYQMDGPFLDEALSKGDECYAIRDGETLAAYGWYSVKPTRMDVPNLFVHFGDEHVYMYKGFTHARYRGQRLHAIGMSRALQHYQSRGYSSFVSYVESNNFDSLKSCARMGFDICGSVQVGNILGRSFIRRGRGCEKTGFRVERAPSLALDLRAPGPPSGGPVLRLQRVGGRH